MMETLIQAVLTGIGVGSVYALIALGFVIIYRSGQVFNLAQGELLLFGAFLSCWMIKSIQLPIWVTILLSLGLSACFGLIIERLTMRPLIGQPMFSRIMVTVALALVIRGLAMVIYGVRDRGFPSIFPEKPLNIGSSIISQPLIWGFCITTFLVISVWRAYSGSIIGLKMSAVAEDHQIARSLGITVEWSMAIAWAVSAITATGAAMILLSGRAVTHSVGYFGLMALPAALIGG